MANSSSHAVISLEERKIQAHKLCSQYIGGSWSEVPLDEFQIKPLYGGFSNYIFICSLPDSYSTDKREVHSVLLRVYGRFYREIVSDVHALVAENVVFALLSERKMAPKLYAIFPDGRLEEFVQTARSLKVAEMRIPANSVKIARKLKQFHDMTLPLCKGPSFFWETCERILADIETMAQEENQLAPQIRQIQKTIDLRKELKFIRDFVESNPSPVLFCHNDVQEGNILSIPRGTDNTGKKNTDFLFIDYEYCCYNYRGFDIANHFCEWTWDLGTDEPPYFKLNLDNFPSREEQLLFFRAYLGKETNLHSKDKISREEQELLDEVKRFVMVSDFFWATWSLVQAKLSTIQFGYMEYGITRLECYQQKKKTLGL